MGCISKQKIKDLQIICCRFSATAPTTCGELRAGFVFCFPLSGPSQACWPLQTKPALGGVGEEREPIQECGWYFPGQPAPPSTLSPHPENKLMKSQIAWLFSPGCAEVSPSLITEHGQGTGDGISRICHPMFQRCPLSYCRKEGFSHGVPLNGPAHHGPGHSALYGHFHSVFLLK